MNHLSKAAFLVNDITIKTTPERLSQNDRARFYAIREAFNKSRTISEFDLSELRRLRALSNRSDVRWLHQDVVARFNTVYNPARPR